MTMATNPSGKRLDGTHWQSDKQECVRGHDLRLEIDGEPNPNVRRHKVTGTRQCVECARLRARLMVRLSTAMRWWEAHCKECKGCPRGRYCDHGLPLRQIVTTRMHAVTAEGFDSSRLVGA